MGNGQDRILFDTMKQVFSVALLLISSAILSPGQHAALDLQGRNVDPIAASRGKLAVLVFVRRDCPISGRYAPTIQRVSDEHRSDTQFYLVFVDKAESPAQLSRYLRDFHYSIPALRDPEHFWVKRARAQITPEAAVFDRRGELVYHGRIDNLYEAIGRARPAPTTHELEDAIQAALAGHAPSVTEVGGVGCFISDLE